MSYAKNFQTVEVNMINLMLGDCLERMKEIPDGSVDLTVTSPPYDNLRTYNNTLPKLAYLSDNCVLYSIYSSFVISNEIGRAHV